MKSLNADEIDQLLPQTQCGLCGFAGCRPYAEALAHKKAAINLCPPGGVKGLLTLGNYCNEDPLPFIEEMEQKTKHPQKAVIREVECIGCTKCIQACPVDAIIGTSKSMHTVIENQCTGCELCIAPCPVDCIEMVPTSDDLSEKKDVFRNAYLTRKKRINNQKDKKSSVNNPLLNDKTAYVQTLLARLKK